MLRDNMKQLHLFVGIILLVIITQVEGYAYFQERIPNGDKVPHPCKPNYLWHGVGHLEVAGGGDRNSFGKDFARNGHKWDSCICTADSDGDGRTNGEELGDPDCEWTEGSTPKITAYTDITHPGICEPLDDPKCQEHNDWDFCNYEDFSCEAFNAEGVKNITLRLPPTNVPAEETTYLCMAFALPDDAVYHVIGSLGVIDNANVIHHITTQGCDQEAGPEILEFFGEPRPCSDYSQMVNQKCPTSFGIWTVGLPGVCYDDAYGVRMGANGINVIVLNFHWNNPERKDDYVDSSGLTFMYTDALRPNDATGLNVGTVSIEIPPGVKSHTEVGYCNSGCTTSMLQEPMYIPEILPHMHYMGRSMIVEHWRNGQLNKQLLSDQNYRYDSPRVYHFNPPIEILPGDAVRVFCNFSSINKDDFTYFGEGTFDEMCFAIMTVYPAQPDIATCISFGSENNAVCSNNNNAILSSYLNCNYTTYFPHFQSHFLTLAAACDTEGKECKTNCKETITEVINSHVCYTGNSLNVTKMVVSHSMPNGKSFLKMMGSCTERLVDSTENIADETSDVERPLCSESSDNTSSGVIPRFYAMLVFGTVIFCMLESRF